MYWVGHAQTQGLSVNSIAGSFSLNFLVYFAEMSSYLSVETNRRKVRKCLRCVKEFSHRFDLENGKYLSTFLGVFARMVKVAHFALVINFCKRIYGNRTRGQLTLSWRRPLPYRNQPIDLLGKSIDCFLYDNGPRHEWVKQLRRRRASYEIKA